MAVVGHVEWVEFLAVDQLTHPGTIGHALRTLQPPRPIGEDCLLTLRLEG